VLALPPDRETPPHDRVRPDAIAIGQYRDQIRSEHCGVATSQPRQNVVDSKWPAELCYFIATETVVRAVPIFRTMGAEAEGVRF
jgi:hypothetical protein